MKKEHIRSICQISLIVAIMCVFAQLSFYVGPIPMTMQTLVVAFSGYLLGLKKSSVAILVYIMLGAVGAPVFSAFNGGFHILIGYTGGFIWGFIPYAILCAIAPKKKIGIVLGLVGMLVCHMIGTVQYALLSETNIFVAFVVASVPFLLKDVIFTIIAYFLASKVRKTIKLS